MHGILLRECKPETLQENNHTLTHLNVLQHKTHLQNPPQHWRSLHTSTIQEQLSRMEELHYISKDNMPWYLDSLKNMQTNTTT